MMKRASGEVTLEGGGPPKRWKQALATTPSEECSKFLSSSIEYVKNRKRNELAYDKGMGTVIPTACV